MFLDKLQAIWEFWQHPIAIATVVGGTVYWVLKHYGDLANEQTSKTVLEWLSNLNAPMISKPWAANSLVTFDKLFLTERVSLQAYLRTLYVTALWTAFAIASATSIDSPEAILLRTELSQKDAFSALVLTTLAMAVGHYIVLKLFRDFIAPAQNDPSAMLIRTYFFIVVSGLIAYWRASSIQNQPDVVRLFTSSVSFSAIVVWFVAYLVGTAIFRFILRFRSALSWFISTLDLEKKPIQALGFIIGAMALVVVSLLAGSLKYLAKST